MRWFLLFFLVLISISSTAQTLVSASAQALPKSSYNKLIKLEDSMKNYALQMIRDESPNKRFTADSVL
jgi:hypothetical protein